MSTTSLCFDVREILINKYIIDCGPNWIKLSNGIIIYLSDDEIEMLNS